ncbi:hypothetical protein VHUM_02039 [Vanrija humicola]|uniref:Beta-mannosidase B n=1 Tax=Vanrija humicola TaxID=5417 RepID=A0A7D8V149_VANHU|nr:hypothetical protein VHUM_02039 [Vanrija humicola]
MRSTSIHAGWEFSQVASSSFPDTKEDWTPCVVPTSVQAELLAAGKIPDPHRGLNEWKVQWIQEADWTFKTTFSASEDDLSALCADLVFEGLDTYCTIVLNDDIVARTDNMFMTHRLDVKGRLQHGNNTLELRFQSPIAASRAEQDKIGFRGGVWGGDSARLYSRKAQYGWGWDWGPIIMTIGPWRPIHLETYEFRIDELRIDTSLSGERYDQADLHVKTLAVKPHAPEGSRVAYSLETVDGLVVKQELVDHAVLPRWDLSHAVSPWWPRGYGQPTLYRMTVNVTDSKGQIVASTSQRVAFRSARVVQETLQDAPGMSFVFEVNGVRMFCGGSNWIPGDTLLTRMSADQYRAWVALAAEGNQNMLRVWGGGVYEHEALYDACDESGILVWQDFMFACGLYPSYPAFDDNVRAEATQAVTRLRTHPSVVIFAGNNEDYMLAEEKGIGYSGDADTSGQFPARYIYETLLPEVVSAHTNDIFYWRSSPYGGSSTRDLTVGDIHQWDVWHGNQAPWSEWDKLAGRFVSEFGMQGYPDLRTVDQYFTDERERANDYHPQSRVSAQHNKCGGAERRLQTYLIENFRHTLDMESYVYYTQIMQAICVATAYRLWRRNWKGRGKEYTAGALVWQLNDCWPVASWAIVDCNMIPKPVYYAIARELKPFTVGMARKENKVQSDPGRPSVLTITSEIQLWACNSSLSPKPVTVDLDFWDLERGLVGRNSHNVTLAPNAATEVWAGEVLGDDQRASDADAPRPIIVGARLLDVDGNLLSEYADWPEPYKFLTFPDPGISITVDGEAVNVSVEKPVKALVFDVEGEPCRWSDNGIDVIPGHPQTVLARGLGTRTVKATYMGTNGTVKL